ncbi:uncharacterized protein [Haliotis asinina]|uniref:uncharacterized protein isoform X2 n=1 Tax=Haliotis asinina TaxID=109174 RepID=UPI00353201D3
MNCVNTEDCNTSMSDAKVHIVTCFNDECEIEYARMCEDLETRGVGCVMEGRGDYGIGSTFMEKFKEMVEKTHVTIIHLCPDMINRLTDLTDVLQGHQSQKYLFIHVRSTPKEIPEIYKKVTRMLLVNDSYYNKIIEKVVGIVQQPISASSGTELIYTSATILTSATKLSSTPELPSAERKDDEYYSDSGIRGHSDIPLRKHDRFIRHVEDEQCGDTGVYFLSSKIQYKAHHRLKWSTKSHLREMCRTAQLYNSSNRSNTVRCLLTKVLPEIFSKKNIPAIAELLAVPVSVVQNKALTKLRDILFSTKPEDIGHSDLQSAEKALFEHCLTRTGFLQPEILSTLIVTYLLTLVYLVVSQRSDYSPLDSTIKRIQQYISKQTTGSPYILDDISVFVYDIQKRIDDVIKAVTAIGTNRKHHSSVKKKSWPIHFCVVLGTLLELFHGDPQTALAVLGTLPSLLKPGKYSVRNVWQKTKVNKRVIQMVTCGMVAYLNALGDTVGEDIEDRAKSAFTTLQFSLKSLDRSMHGMARCLMFSQSPVVRQGAMALWKDVSDETTDSLMVTEVLKHLQPISINLRHKRTTDHSTDSTGWKIASTEIGSDKIMIHVSLPPGKRSKQYLFKPSECGHLTTIEILRALCTQPHILSMWAYRIDQLPAFYITEDYSQQNFQEVLYYSAKNESWFQPLELMQFLIQALEAVIALHEHGYIHRDLTAASFAYDKQSKSIKLCRFILARKCGREETVVDRECSSIPMRWSAPESLKQHHFSRRSDYWMVGHLIYEVITHGCLPYSDLEGQNEYTIEKLIKENKKKLLQERCIPTSVFDVIQSCTRFDDTHRMSVCEAKSRLEETYDRYEDCSELPSRITSVTPDVLFPGLDRTSFQHLQNEVETCAYYGFRNLENTANMNDDPYEEFGVIDGVYFPLVSSQKMDKLFRRLTQKEESQLNTENIPGIYSRVEVVEKNQTEYLVYDFPTRDWVSLSKVMDVRSFGVWSVEYIRCLTAVAKTLSLLHQRSWVHGSLSADNIWISESEVEDECKVCFSDLGYMRRSCDTDDGVIADTSFVVPQDVQVYRRSPPEVIRNGTYTCASDVFSFGLILWNGFSNFSSYHNITDLNKLESIPKDKLYEYLTTTPGHKILPKPARCPDAIYSLMLLCWDPARHERPQMTTVLQKLLEAMGEVPQYSYPDAYASPYNNGQPSEDYYYYENNHPDTYTSPANTGQPREDHCYEKPMPKVSDEESFKVSFSLRQLSFSEESSLQCDGPYSSVASSSQIGGSTEVLLDSDTSLKPEEQETLKRSASTKKPNLEPKDFTSNEQSGKDIQLQKYLAASLQVTSSKRSVMNDPESTALLNMTYGHMKSFGKPGLIPRSKCQSLSIENISTSSENACYEQFNDSDLKKRNSKPNIPPKPKDLLWKTYDDTSMRGDHPYRSCDDHTYKKVSKP